MQQLGHNRIGAIGENISFDNHPVAFDLFGGKTASVDFRKHAVDHGSPASIEGAIRPDWGWQNKL